MELVPGQLLMSVTFMTIVKIPVCNGVPLSTPADDNVSPLGKGLLVEKV